LVAVGLAVARVAAASPMAPIPPGEGVRTVVGVAPAGATTSAVLYLNRCVGGCTVHRGNNDATTDSSSILMGSGDSLAVSAFGYTDTDWQNLVQCVREVYSPYAITITDVRPTTGRYNEAIVAGVPAEIGYDGKTLGVAPLARDCSPLDNAVSFSFANAHPVQDLIANLCWTVAQESAHVYGLDHEYRFLDPAFALLSNKGSACSDPMTYLTDCLSAGEKFFRNATAACGTTTEQPGCGPQVTNYSCSASQNSHRALTTLFGAGTPLTPAPAVSISIPKPGVPVDLTAPVHAQASSKRGVVRVELLLNGFSWASLPGVKFGSAAQLPSDYALAFPRNLPDGVVDIQVRAHDDIGSTTTTDPVTFTKGQPCVDASTCLTGQRCEAGKCFWDPPTGELGDACTYPQACKSLVCVGVGDQKLCSQDCTLGAKGSVPGADGTCPSGFTCLASGAATTDGSPGVCLIGSGGGGCCSVGGDGPGAVIGHGALGLAIVAWLARRRKRDEFS
jgi:MYXO-CTERM domain-containing protein